MGRGRASSSFRAFLSSFVFCCFFRSSLPSLRVASVVGLILSPCRCLSESAVNFAFPVLVVYFVFILVLAMFLYVLFRSACFRLRLLLPVFDFLPCFLGAVRSSVLVASSFVNVSVFYVLSAYI